MAGSSSNSKGTNAPVANPNHPAGFGEGGIPGVTTSQPSGASNPNASTGNPLIQPKSNNPLIQPKSNNPLNPSSTARNRDSNPSNNNNVENNNGLNPTPSKPLSPSQIKQPSFDPFGNQLYYPDKDKPDQARIGRFASQSSYEKYLSDRGLGNNGTITDVAKFSKSDFSAVGGPNNSGVSVFTSPTKNASGGKNVNLNLSENLNTDDTLGGSTTGKISSSSPIISARPPSSEAGKPAIPTQASEGQSYGYAWADTQQSKIGSKVFSNQTQINSKEDVTSLLSSEADRAKSTFDKSNPTSFFGGNNRGNPNPVLDKAITAFGKTKSGEYGQKDVLTTNQLYGGSNEEAVKQSEAARASAFYGNSRGVKSDYLTGGTPQDTSVGVITPQSQGKSFGWKDIAPDQFSRGSAKEEAVKQSEAQKSSTVYASKSNVEFTPLVNLTDVNVQKSNKSIFQFAKTQNETGKSNTKSPNSIIKPENKLGVDLVGSDVIKATQTKNLPEQLSFANDINTWAKEGDTINVFSNGKKIGSVSGPNAYSDIMKLNDKYPNGIEARLDYATTPQGKGLLSQASKGAVISFQNVNEKDNSLGSSSGVLTKNNASPQNLDLIVGDTKSFSVTSIIYPEEEKAIIGSISKNPSFFESFTQKNPNYFQGLANKGKLQASDFDTINGIFHDYDRSQNIKNEAVVKQQAKDINNVVSRNDPSYYFAFKDEKGNPVRVITPKSEQVNPDGTAKTIGGGVIGPTTTGQRSFYDVLQVNKIAPVPVTTEPHFSNRFAISDLNPFRKVPLSPNAQRIVNTNEKLDKIFETPQSKPTPQGNVPKGLGSTNANNERLDDITTSLIAGRSTKTQPNQPSPNKSGFSAIVDSIIGGGAYYYGVGESVFVHLPNVNSPLPQSGQIPNGLVNSTKPNSPQMSDVVTPLLTGSKTNVQYSKSEPQSNLGLDLYHTIVPIQTYLIHDTGTLLGNAAKQIASVNYFVKYSTPKETNFEKPTFNISEIHSASPNLTPEATNLINKTSSPNPINIIMGKETLQKGYDPLYYDVKVALNVAPILLGGEGVLLAGGKVIKPLGSAIKTKVGQAARESAINYGSPIVSRPAPRFGNRFEEPSKITNKENPVLVIFNNKIAKPVKTKAGDIIGPYISVSSHVETVSGYGKTGKIELGGTQKERYVPKISSNIYQETPQEKANRIKESLDNTKTPQGESIQPSTTFVSMYENPRYSLESYIANLPKPQTPGISSFKSPVQVSATRSSLDNNQNLFTSRGLVAGNVSGKPQGNYALGQAGTVSSEHYESTVPNLNNDWYTSQGNPTKNSFNSNGVGIFNAELKRKKTKSGNAVIGLFDRGNAGKQKGLVVDRSSRAILASGLAPTKGVLQVDIAFGSKSATPQYLSRYGPLEILSERKSITGRRQRERATVPLTGPQAFSEVSSIWGTRTEKSSLIDTFGHTKATDLNYKGVGKYHYESNAKLLSDLPQTREGSIGTKYTTSGEKLSSIPESNGVIGTYFMNEKGEKIGKVRASSMYDDAIRSLNAFKELIGQRENDFLTFDASKIAPKGTRPEIFNTEKGKEVKINESYEPLRFGNFAYQTSKGGPLKGKFKTENPEYSFEEYTSSALSPQESALRERYPLKASTAYEASFDTKFNAFFGNVDDLAGQTKAGNFFNKNDRWQKAINSNDKSTRELTGSSHGPNRGVWQPKETRITNDRLANITHVSKETEGLSFSVKPTTKTSTQSLIETNLSHNPKNLGIFKQLGSKQKKGEREYKHNISINTGVFNKLFRRKNAKNKVINIKFGESKPYTTKKETKLDNAKLYGEGEHVWFEPQQKSIGNMKENKRALITFESQRGYKPKLSGNAKRTAKQPVRRYISVEKLDLVGKQNVKRRGTTNIKPNTGGFSFSTSKKSTSNGTEKENKSIGGSITQLITKQESKSEIKSPRFTDNGIKPRSIYRSTNPENQPSEEFYTFRPGGPPARPTASKSKSSSALGLLAGTAGILGINTSISSQYAQLNNSIQGISSKSSQISSQSSVLDNMTRVTTKSNQRQSSKQSSLFKQSNAQAYRSDQSFKQLQGSSSKQSSKQGSKQTSAFQFDFPTSNRQTSRTVQKEIQIFQPNQPQITTTKKKLPPPVPLLFGPYPKGRKTKGREGPTAILNLDVNNIFSSSLSIKVAKGKRFEF